MWMRSDLPSKLCRANPRQSSSLIPTDTLCSPPHLDPCSLESTCSLTGPWSRLRSLWRRLGTGCSPQSKSLRRCMSRQDMGGRHCPARTGRRNTRQSKTFRHTRPRSPRNIPPDSRTRHLRPPGRAGTSPAARCPTQGKHPHLRVFPMECLMVTVRKQDRK